MRNFGAKNVNCNFLGQKGPKQAFLHRKMGAEAAGGDTAGRCGRKKVAGHAPGPRGHIFGVIRAVVRAVGDRYWLKTIVINFRAKKGQNGPFLAVFRELLRCEGPKCPKNLANRSLYLYGPCAFDRSGFWTLRAENEFVRGLACLLACVLLLAMIILSEGF